MTVSNSLNSDIVFPRGWRCDNVHGVLVKIYGEYSDIGAGSPRVFSRSSFLHGYQTVKSLLFRFLSRLV